MIEVITVKTGAEKIPASETKEREIGQESFSSNKDMASSHVGISAVEKVAEPGKSEKGKQNTGGKQAQKSETAKEQLHEAIERVKSTVNNFGSKLDLEIDEELNITIIKVIDKETDEVIRQIPSEELIAHSKNSQDLKGLLVDREG